MNIVLKIVGMLVIAIFLIWLNAVLNMWAFMELQEVFTEHLLWSPITKYQALALTSFISLFWIHGTSKKTTDAENIQSCVMGLLRPLFVVLFANLLKIWFL